MNPAKIVTTRLTVIILFAPVWLGDLGKFPDIDMENAAVSCHVKHDCALF